MALLDPIRKLFDAIVFQGLRTRDFVAVMGVEDAGAVAALLRADDEDPQPYRDVYGLHSLRWLLFDPNRTNDEPPVIDAKPQMLVLALVFDGNFDDVFADLLAKAGPSVRGILSSCIGFSTDTDPKAFLRERETKTGYFFRDLGPPIAPPVSQWWTLPTEPDPTRVELEDAFSIKGRLEAFDDAHSSLSPEDLRRAFSEEFGKHTFPLPLTRFERRLRGEESWTRRMIDTARKRQDAASRSGDGRVRRDVHAKGHGLVHAKFEVLGHNRPELEVGLFATPGIYDAVLRPSNGESKVQPDTTRDARGLALRVRIPANAAIAGAAPQYVFPEEAGPDDSGFGKQDFILMNTPVFFVPDIRRLAMLSAIGLLESKLRRIIGIFAFVAGRGGLRQFFLFVRALRSRPSHPFEMPFHSTTAYLLGKGHVVKYAVEADEPERFLADSNRSRSLSENLKASLERGSIKLNFFVYVFAANENPKGLGSLVDAVEDATLNWEALGATKVQVATIHIHAQDPTTRMEEAENEQFSPWNALEEHQPIGNLNRARWAAYKASQEYRAAQRDAALLSQAAE